MAYITDAELKTALTAMMRRNSVHDIPPLWDELVAESNLAGYGEIISRLMDRGFSQAQIDAWDRRKEFNRDIGLYWCLVKGAGLDGYDDKFIERLNRREELDTVAVIIGGEIEDPVDASGSVGHGSLVTSDDIFGLDPDDSNRGEPTVW